MKRLLLKEFVPFPLGLKSNLKFIFFSIPKKLSCILSDCIVNLLSVPRILNLKSSFNCLSSSKSFKKLISSLNFGRNSG